MIKPISILKTNFKSGLIKCWDPAKKQTKYINTNYIVSFNDDNYLNNTTINTSDGNTHTFPQTSAEDIEKAYYEAKDFGSAVDVRA